MVAVSSQPGAVSRHPRGLTLTAVMAIVVLLCSAWTNAGEVLIVKSSDAEPYVQAETAVREQLGLRHYSIRVEALKSTTDKGAGLVAAGAEAVVAIGTPAAKYLHGQLPQKVRLIYCMVSNPDESGLLEGRASFGVTTDVAPAEQIRLIAEALPRARIVGMLYRSDSTDGKRSVERLKQTVPSDWSIEAVAVNDFPSVAAGIEALTQKKLDVIWTSADQKLYDTAAVRSLLLAALRNKIPVWGFSPAFVRAGGLLGVGVEPRAQGRQAAELLIMLIEQPQPPVQRAQPAREFQIAVNLIVARQLGLQIPEELAHRATYVFRPEN